MVRCYLHSRYTCDPGFQFSNGAVESTITCGTDGEWTPLISECIRKSLSFTPLVKQHLKDVLCFQSGVSCGPPTLPEANKLFSNYDPNNPPKAGFNITIRCSPGYYFKEDPSQSEFEATCKLLDTEWEYTRPAPFTTNMPQCIKGIRKSNSCKSLPTSVFVYIHFSGLLSHSTNHSRWS